MESQRDKRLETFGLVLQVAELDQVVRAIFGALDVAVKHGRGGMQTQFVRSPVHLQPHVGADLMVADHAPHGGSKDFRPSARQRPQPGILKPLQDFLHRHPGDVGVVGNFNRRKGFQVDRRKALLQPAEGDRRNTGKANRDAARRQCEIL